ncbi:hypothetical protein V1478_015869 [Vespula squamosa]|uniref:Uncharacterized protein n=1 Tax=Vespula squamosa TaxID=30214 RepID=A0ABD2A248_VESSQ
MQMRDPRFGLGLDWQIARGAALRLKLPDGTTPSNNNKKKKKKKKRRNKKEPSENEDDDDDDDEEEEENEAVRARTSLKVGSRGDGGGGGGDGGGPLGPDVVPLPPAIHYELSVRGQVFFWISAILSLSGCSFSGQRESFACRDTTVRSASRFRG